MTGIKRWVRLCLALGLAAGATGAAWTRAAAPEAERLLSDLDLSTPFATATPWRFRATQGPEIEDPVGLAGKVAGAVTLCLSKGARGACDSSLRSAVQPEGADGLFGPPHALEKVGIVHPRKGDGRALLLVRTASLRSVNGNQGVLTQLLAYDAASDRFRRVFEQVVGRNNNEEVRFLETGPLQGRVVVAEPTGDAPYRYWITVHAPTPALAYGQVLRFRSATAYGDGNPLAVIDSEMPNIQRRLGVWRRGMPLPLPAAGCAGPRLVRTVLWCG